MSGGDSLEHECQSSVENTFARMQFRFSCICPTHKHNIQCAQYGITKQYTLIRLMAGETKPEYYVI